MIPPDETIRSDRDRFPSPSPSPAPLRPGDILSQRYEIGLLLGEGGMGAVYEARDRELGITIALKTLASRLVADEDALRDLKREVLLARQVTHENVCRLHDLWRDAERGLSFCTMELLRGRTLAACLREEGPLDLGTAGSFAREMIRGLDAAHNAGVVHRDFKSANVMIVDGSSGGEARLVLTDFGIAQPINLRDARQARGRTQITGTPAYMAPEQLRGEPAGPAADIYALGIVLFEMLTGQLPFQGDDTRSAMLRRLSEDPPSPKRYRDDIPELWESVILQCLAREPSRRYGRVTEVAVGLEDEEVTLRVPRTPVGNLPPARDAFLGREEELARIESRLEDGARLVSLLGMGGAGKTRLACEYAGRSRIRWPGGVWFCDLTEARSLDGILSALARTLDVPLGRENPVAQLGHAIAGRGCCLLILDNFEQVATHASATLGVWQEEAPECRLLVTSRERLQLTGEEAVELDALQESDAVELFLDRARRHRPGFDGSRAREEIAGLVRRLEKLPLAIELAAARMRVMSPADISRRLSDRFRVLSGGKSTDRHRALRAAIDTSWNLLEPWEQSAFAQCSVFEGGFTLEAAEAVLDLAMYPDAPWSVDIVQSLLDKSLLRMASTGVEEPRFTMYVTLQEYAASRLGDGEDRERAEARHGEYYARFGTRAHVESLDHHGGAERRAHLARDLDNLVAACRRALSRGDGPTATHALEAAWAVLELRGPFTAGRELAREVLSMPGLDPEQTARALLSSGWASALAGRLEDADREYERALEICREHGDRGLEGQVLGLLAIPLYERGEGERARDRLEQALAIHREVGDRRLEGLVLGNLALLIHSQRDLPTARELYVRALEIHRDIGNRRYEGIVLGNFALLHADTGHLEEARKYYEESLAIHRQVGNRRFEGIICGNLGNLHFVAGRREEARERMMEALAIQRSVGGRKSEGIVLQNLGSVYSQLGLDEEAGSCYEQSLEIQREVGYSRGQGVILSLIGERHRKNGRLTEAREALAEAGELLRKVGDKLELAKHLCREGRLELDLDDKHAARAVLHEICALKEEMGPDVETELRQELEDLRRLVEERTEDPTR